MLIMVHNGRKAQCLAKIPFRELLPLKLRDKVSGKGGRTSEVACMQQMQAMFTCLKQNDFDQTKCSSEVSTFQKCYNEFQGVKYQKQIQKDKESIAPGVKTITSKQLNVYLRKFPQPK